MELKIKQAALWTDFRQTDRQIEILLHLGLFFKKFLWLVLLSPGACFAQGGAVMAVCSPTSASMLKRSSSFTSVQWSQIASRCAWTASSSVNLSCFRNCVHSKGCLYCHFAAAIKVCMEVLAAIFIVADRKKELTWEFSFAAGNEE